VFPWKEPPDLKARTINRAPHVPETASDRVGWAKARSAVPTRSFTEADQQIAATIGERKRVEKRTAFDLEPPIV